MGRRPKRQEITEANGSARANPAQAKAHVPVTKEIPLPTEAVQQCEKATAYWHKITEQLALMGFICKEDEHVLEQLCLNYVLLMSTYEQIRRHGDSDLTAAGAVKSNGYHINYKNYQAIHSKLLDQLGLTPTGRASLAPPLKHVQENDPVNDLLSKLASGSK